MKALAPDDPRVIGEYRLRAQLGAGGMGRVYLGLSPAGRAVAIKIVNPDLAGDAEFLQRFAQEVAAARAVSGIYTAPVVASGLNERPPWLATAFVPGPSLDQVVSENGPLPEPALWPLLAGLTEAMAAIHACGVVHRDLKPANVLLATDGPRVIDFGISRATDGTMLTAAGVVFGTPGYMSPEQAEGKPAGLASDMFALGCVIAYAATGTGPFGTGTAAAVLYRVVHAEAALDGVPPGLREIISGCLAKDPAARPTPTALGAAIANRHQDTGPSAVAFWPRPVANVIGAYQARLEQETKGSRPAEEVWWASAAHAAHSATTPAPSPAPAASPSPAASPAPAASPSPAPSPAQPPPVWPSPAPPSAWPAQPPLQSAGAPGSAAQGYAGPQGHAGPQGYAAAPGRPQSQGYPQSQGHPQPQGYPGPQGYGSPQPQGYGGAQASPAPPRGYLPNAQPAGYPQQPYQVGRAPLAPLPGSMRNAIGLMYAGAAYTLVYAIGVVIVANAIISKYPVVTRTPSGRVSVGGVVALTVLLSLIEIALWLGIARACRNGRSWARVAGTVLFGVHTVGFLGVLANSHPGIGLTKVLTTLSWLIACGAVVFLWQRPSSMFFRAAATPGRPV
jgi:serine/threonine kinase PknH